MRRQISKKEIARQVKEKTAKADRMRAIVRDGIYPLLKELNGNVKYTKIVLHTASVVVEGAFNKKKEETKIKDLDLLSIFDNKDPNYKVYADLFKLLADEDINSFQNMVRDLPDNLDRFFFNEGEAKPFNEIDIDKILG